MNSLGKELNYMPFLIFAILLSMVVAVFAVQNPVTVPLNFVFWDVSVSLVIVILGSFLIGILAGAIFLVLMKAKHYLHDKKRLEEIDKLQKEIEKLQEHVSMLEHAQMLHEKAGNKGETVATKASDTGKQV